MNRRDCFSTPCFVHQVPESEALCEALAEWFIGEARTRPSVERSIQSGWHSAADLALRDEPLMQAATELFRSHFEQAVAHLYADAGQRPPALSLRLTVWATVLEAGGYSVVHDHGETQLSAVFWPRAGLTDDLSGWLEFVDPRRHSLQLPDLAVLKGRTRVCPADGALVVFPGYLQHFVHPYRGTTPRVSLAANATITEIKPPHS